jgi:hypothetical protein
VAPTSAEQNDGGLNFGALGPEDGFAVFEVEGFAFIGVVVEGDLAGQIIGDVFDGVESSAAVGFGVNGFDEADGDFCAGRAEVDGDGIDFKDAVVIARIGRDPFADQTVWHCARSGRGDPCGDDKNGEDQAESNKHSCYGGFGPLRQCDDHGFHSSFLGEIFSY